MVEHYCIVYLVFDGEFKKKCRSPNMVSSISFWRVLVSVHSPFWRVFEKNGFPHEKVLISEMVVF
jgi:hypothetical protein